MRRLALTALLAATMAPAAHATHDRSDPIPASVGPADTRSYWVNADANRPAGVDRGRFLDIAQRTLQRWGATYLGTTTTASPDNHRDDLDVIGFSTSTELDDSVVGLNTKVKGGTVRTPGGGETCAVAADMGTTQTVTPVPSTVRLRLRSDRVRKGRVRRRSITTTRTLTAPRVDSTPVSGQRCVHVQPGGESDPATVFDESDVQLRATGAAWFDGEGDPPTSQVDLESVLIHELGHAAGLAHQPQNCDPRTPMRPSGGGGDFWRGVDEYRYADCASYAEVPDPAHGAEAAFPGGTLGGRAIHVNPAVPAGYDSARFVAVAQNVIGRWGGTFAGTTEARPAQGDGVSVIGFDVIARTQYEVTNRTTTERLVFAPYRTCTIVEGPVASYRVKKATKKVRVRVRGRRRVLKLRRDRVVKRTVSGPATGQCVDHPAESRSAAPVVETDIGIAHEMDAYDMGPAHPVLETKVDMATLLASALGQAAGIAPAACGATATPVTSVIPAGDWWHTPADLKRMPCPAPNRAAAAPEPTEPSSGSVVHVKVQD